MMSNRPSEENLYYKLEEEIIILTERIAGLEKELETITRSQFWRFTVGLRFLIGVSSRIFFKIKSTPKHMGNLLLRNTIYWIREKVFTRTIQKHIPLFLKIFLKKIAYKILKNLPPTNPYYSTQIEEVTKSIFEDIRFGDLVSVVLPTYNHAEYLDESIQSVLSQDYENIELIVVNDGSTDRTEQILQKYIGHPKIAVLRQENSQLPSALNSGFSHASGKLLTWTSADNKYEPQAISELVKFLIKNIQVALVYGDYRIIDESGNPNRGTDFRLHNQSIMDSSIIRIDPNSDLLKSMPDNFIGPLFMYRREIHFWLGGYAQVPGIEDYEYWLRIAMKFKIQHLHNIDPLYSYRVHKNTMSENQRILQIPANLQHLRDVYEYRLRGELKDYDKSILESLAGKSFLINPNPRLITKIKKVALVLDSFGFGGLEKVAESLVYEWQNLEISVEIFINSTTDEAVINAFPGIKMNICPTTDLLIKSLEQFGPDIINLHYSYKDLKEMSRKLKIPSVQTLHNTYVWLTKSELVRLKESHRFVDHNISVSENVTSWAIKTLGIESLKISEIKNGVNLYKNENAMTTKVLERPYFLCLGSLAVHKRQEQVVEAFSRWKESSGDKKYKLILAGAVADSTYHKTILNLIQNLGLEQDVEIMDFLENQIPLIQESSACVLTSMYEGGSIFLIEAALAGIPIIATDVGDVVFLSKFTKVFFVSNTPRDLSSISSIDVQNYSRHPGKEFTSELVDAFDKASKFENQERVSDDLVRQSVLSAKRMAFSYIKIFETLASGLEYEKSQSPDLIDH